MATRAGHVKEDLVELMMIQNAQMHQVIMNNMTMSALSAFGYSQAQPAPSQTHIMPITIEESEPDVVYHHYYDPYPYSNMPSWYQSQPPGRPTNREGVVRHLNGDARSTVRKDVKAVPPPPPPSATGTVGADIPPASEYYDVADGKI
uniref:DUF4587 domain-containing protein n=1 Tax=Latimeria chalumnae TaxID=7897 RepID=H3ASR8_LATCH